MPNNTKLTRKATGLSETPATSKKDSPLVSAVVTTTPKAKPVRHRRGYRAAVIEVVKAFSVWENIHLYHEKNTLKEEEEALQKLSRAAYMMAHYVNQRLDENSPNNDVSAKKEANGNKKEITAKNRETITDVIRAHQEKNRSTVTETESNDTDLEYSCDTHGCKFNKNDGATTLVDDENNSIALSQNVDYVCQNCKSEEDESASENVNETVE